MIIKCHSGRGKGVSKNSTLYMLVKKLKTIDDP